MYSYVWVPDGPEGAWELLELELPAVISHLMRLLRTKIPSPRRAAHTLSSDPSLLPLAQLLETALMVLMLYLRA